ncbi:hypothetical protein [Streptomyces sp. NPDC046887]
MTARNRPTDEQRTRTGAYVAALQSGHGAFAWTPDTTVDSQSTPT